MVYTYIRTYLPLDVRMEVQGPDDHVIILRVKIAQLTPIKRGIKR